MTSRAAFTRSAPASGRARLGGRSNRDLNSLSTVCAPLMTSSGTSSGSGGVRTSSWSQMFTPNGFEVRSRISRIAARTCSGRSRSAARTPSPPALDTAAAKSTPATPPIPDCRTGASMPRTSCNRGLSSRGLGISVVICSRQAGVQHTRLLRQRPGVPIHRSQHY